MAQVQRALGQPQESVPSAEAIRSAHLRNDGWPNGNPAKEAPLQVQKAIKPPATNPTNRTLSTHKTLSRMLGQIYLFVIFNNLFKTLFSPSLTLFPYTSNRHQLACGAPREHAIDMHQLFIYFLKAHHTHKLFCKHRARVTTLRSMIVTLQNHPSHVLKI